MTTENVAIIEEFNIAIKLDDGVLLGYEIENGEILLHTEGVFKEMCQELATIIERHFQINLADYGITVIDYEIEIDSVNNCNYKPRIK